MLTRKKESIIVAIVIVLWTVGSIIYCEFTSAAIEKNGRYTIGVVTRFKMNFRNGYTIFYEYEVSGIQYHENLLVPQDHPGIDGGRFFVKFDSERPDHSLILIEKPVSVNVSAAPSLGWEKLPE